MMHPCLTHSESAILGAQLAFVRRERYAQWKTPRLFREFAGAPTQRLATLTHLCDELGEQLLALLQAHPAWGQLVADGHGRVTEVAAAVAERVARYGVGVPSEDVEGLDQVFRRRWCETLPPAERDRPDGWPPVHRSGLLYPTCDVDGTRSWWPVAVPPSLAADAITWDPDDA